MSDYVKLEVGGVYRCLDGYVKIVSIIDELKEFVEIIALGLACDVEGKIKVDSNAINIGWFTKDGDYCWSNPLLMCGPLKSIKGSAEVLAEIEELKQCLKRLEDRL